MENKKGLRTWSRRSTENTPTPDAGHGLEEYETKLGFNRKELEGLTVLDLGSGATEKLSRELKESGVNSNIISLNPDYIYEDIRNTATQSGWQGKSVAALAQELPFKNESFDAIIGLNSVSIYANISHPEALQAWLSEIARVLRSGGKALIGPLGFTYNAEDEKRLVEQYEPFFIEIKKLGLSVNLETIQNQSYLKRIVISKP